MNYIYHVITFVSPSLRFGEMSGSGSDEAEAIARASAAAEELYRLRDTYFPRDSEEKTSKLRTLADTALALLDSLPLGTTVTPLSLLLAFG